jgi:hypothetical protein
MSLKLPFQWPAGWTRPDTIRLLRELPATAVLGAPAELRRALQQTGTTVLDSVPADAAVVKGEWPSVRVTDRASAGPTAAPWIDSNGWKIRLERARRPGAPVWVDVQVPDRGVLVANSYLVAIADAAANGGQWILKLDARWSEALAASQPDALADWGRLGAALRFFAAHADGEGYRSAGVLGILSDFKGENEFFSGELLNLTARRQMPYRILEKTKALAVSGLLAIIYADGDPPAPKLRRQLMEFVRGGGLLLAGKSWPDPEGAIVRYASERVTLHALGKGRLAIEDLQDPFETAADAQVLLSRRHDLVRMFNGYSCLSYLTESADRKSARLHMVNYAGRANADDISLRVAGAYGSARIRLLERPEPEPLRTKLERDAIELFLPAIAVYGAIDLV